MVGFEQLATRYFPEQQGINIWIQLAQYWTQKSDVILSYDESAELYYSYLLFSMADTGFVLVIEEENKFASLRKKFGQFNEFVFLSVEDSAENQKKAIVSIENQTAKVVVTSVQRFFQKGNKFLEYLKSYQVQQIAIHDVYKLSSWGEYKEVYKNLAQLKQYLRHVPVIAVAPLYTIALEKDVKSILHLQEPVKLYLNTLPDNYTYSVFRIENHHSIQNVIHHIAQKHNAEKGILITKETQNYTVPDNMVVSLGNENISFAVFTELPQNLEKLYFFQQDNVVPTLYLLYSEQSVKQHKTDLQNKYTQKIHLDIATKRFEQVREWCNVQICKKQFLQKHWQMLVGEPCGKCNVCIHEPEEDNHTAQNCTHEVQKLKDMLTAKRLQLAKANNVLIPNVFADITLEELAVYLPQTKADLQYIAGLGIKKIELYGDSVLDTILEYCALYGVSDNMQTLKEKRNHTKHNTNLQIAVSVVKKAKINAAVQELGYWNSQLIQDFLNSEEITLAEIESVLMAIQVR